MYPRFVHFSSPTCTDITSTQPAPLSWTAATASRLTPCPFSSPAPSHSSWYNPGHCITSAWNPSRFTTALTWSELFLTSPPCPFPSYMCFFHLTPPSATSSLTKASGSHVKSHHHLGRLLRGQSELDGNEIQSSAPSHFLKENTSFSRETLFLQHHCFLQTLQNSTSESNLKFRSSV